MKWTKAVSEIFWCLVMAVVAYALAALMFAFP